MILSVRISSVAPVVTKLCPLTLPLATIYFSSLFMRVLLNDAKMVYPFGTALVQALEFALGSIGFNALCCLCVFC